MYLTFSCPMDELGIGILLKITVNVGISLSKLLG